MHIKQNVLGLFEFSVLLASLSTRAPVCSWNSCCFQLTCASNYLENFRIKNSVFPQLSPFPISHSSLPLNPVNSKHLLTFIGYQAGVRDSLTSGLTRRFCCLHLMELIQFDKIPPERMFKDWYNSNLKQPLECFIPIG